MSGSVLVTNQVWAYNLSSWINSARNLVSSVGHKPIVKLTEHQQQQQQQQPCQTSQVQPKNDDGSQVFEETSGFQALLNADWLSSVDLLALNVHPSHGTVLDRVERALDRLFEETTNSSSSSSSVNRTKTPWKTSFTSWGSFQLDASLPCTPKELWDITFGPSALLGRSNLVKHHEILSNHSALLGNSFLPDFQQQRRGFKTYRRRSLMNNSSGDGSGSGSSSSSMIGSKSKANLDTTAGKMKLFSDHERYDKLKGLFNDPLLPRSELDKLKVAFAEGYLAAGDPNRAQSRASRFLRAFQQILMITVFMALLISLMGNVGPGMFRVSVGNGNEVMPEDIHESFDDVKGADEAKQELKDVVEFLRSPKRFVTLGGKLPKGVLLVGPPGTGKTLLARAVAGEAGVPFFHAAGPEFDEVLVGQGARRVRDLFRAAKARAPCVVFIDEIDSVGSKRTNSILHPYANQTINQLLAEMDGFVQNEGVIVLGATNRREDLDKALLRPGRFDVEVQVPVPDYEGRVEIIRLYLAKVKRGPDVNEEKLSRGTTGFTGADIENLVNQAALRAAMDGSDYVMMKHLEFARDKILMGPERKSRIPDEEANRITAFHEGGHALVAWYTKEAQTLHKVTIIPRGPSLGHTSYIPEKERYHITKAQMLAMLDTFMGGRAAEELIFGRDNITSGASSDLKQATSMAEHMVKEFGMSEKVGLRYHERAEGGLVVVNDASNATAEAIDSEINRILNESHQRATNVLKEHVIELNLLADALLKYETLDVEDIKAIVEGKDLMAVSARHDRTKYPAAPRAGPTGSPFPAGGGLAPGPGGANTPLPSGI